MRNRTHAERETRNPLFTVLRTRRRRSILRHLLDRTTLSERELALALAATERGLPTADVPNEEARDVRLEIRHSHLPVLEDHGLVTWERKEETVTATDHASLADSRFHRLLRVEGEGVDDVLVSLSNERRRLLLAILRDDSAPSSVRELAREIARRETGETSPSRATLDEIAVTLTHTHLPTLRSAAIVDYDAESGRAAYSEHPVLEELLAVLREPDDRLVDKLDGFFGGLLASYRRASEYTADPFDLPNFWSESHYG